MSGEKNRRISPSASTSSVLGIEIANRPASGRTPSRHDSSVISSPYDRSSIAMPASDSRSVDIKNLLERVRSEAAIGVEKAFAGLAVFLVKFDEAADRADNLARGETAAGDGADAGVVGARTAERDLVEFIAFFIDAEDSDMTGVVVAAGVDAAGDFYLQLADVSRFVRICEALGDLLRHRNRAGVC